MDKRHHAVAVLWLCLHMLVAAVNCSDLNLAKLAFECVQGTL
jgi:hypothetical protein